MKQAIADALEQDPYLCDKNMVVQFEKLLLQPLAAVPAARIPAGGLTIVVDALDECKEEHMKLFLELLKRIPASGDLHLRIFLTSRPESYIQCGFKDICSAVHNDVILEDVQASNIEGDIRRYFQNEFAEIRRSPPYCPYNDPLPLDWPAERDVEFLVERSGSLFIFASTVCRFVGEAAPQTRLKEILQLQRSVSSLHIHGEHSYLRIMYAQILQCIIAGISGDDRARRISAFRNVVGALIFAREPLSTRLLADLFGEKLEGIYGTLDSLKSVMHLPENPDSPIKFLHLSFSEFLQDETNADNEVFKIDALQSHRQLFRNCLYLLLKPGVLRRDICDVKNPQTRQCDVPIAHIDAHIPSAVRYACRKWHDHLWSYIEILVSDRTYHCGVDEQQEDMYLFTSFLQSRLLEWHEVFAWGQWVWEPSLAMQLKIRDLLFLKVRLKLFVIAVDPTNNEIGRLGQSNDRSLGQTLFSF
jgi:hypothetical protein